MTFPCFLLFYVIAFEAADSNSFPCRIDGLIITRFLLSFGFSGEHSNRDDDYR